MAKIFDLERALISTDGDKELLGELFDLFKEQYPQLLNQIEQAVQAQDAEELRYAAHTLKSSLGNIGAMKAYELALTLETMGVNKDMESAGTAYESLKKEVEKFNKEVTHFKETVV